MITGELIVAIYAYYDGRGNPPPLITKGKPYRVLYALSSGEKVIRSDMSPEGIQYYCGLDNKKWFKYFDSIDETEEVLLMKMVWGIL